MTPDELYEARIAMNLTQEQLAEAFGVNVQTVSRCERGESSMPAWLSGDVARVVLRLERELRKVSE